MFRAEEDPLEQAPHRCHKADPLKPSSSRDMGPRELPRAGWGMRSSGSFGSIQRASLYRNEGRRDGAHWRFTALTGSFETKMKQPIRQDYEFIA